MYDSSSVTLRKQPPALCQCLPFPESLGIGWMIMEYHLKSWATPGSIWFSDTRALCLTPAQLKNHLSLLLFSNALTFYSTENPTLIQILPFLGMEPSWKTHPTHNWCPILLPTWQWGGQGPLYNFTSSCIQLSGLMVMGKCWLFPWQQIPKLTETISLSILKLNSSASMATEVIKRCKLKCCTGMMAWQERHLFRGNSTKNLKLEASLCPKAHHSHGRGSPTHVPQLPLASIPASDQGYLSITQESKIRDFAFLKAREGIFRGWKGSRANLDIQPAWFLIIMTSCWCVLCWHSSERLERILSLLVVLDVTGSRWIHISQMEKSRPSQAKHLKEPYTL